MLLSVFAVLNSKLRTAVQTTEAHHAFILDPDRPLPLHFNGLNRTLSGTQTTSDTSVLYTKIYSAPYLNVINWFGNPFSNESWGARRHTTVLIAFFDAADDTTDFSLGVFGVLRNFFWGGKIKDRSPCICHLNRIVGIYFSTLNCLICYCARCAGCCSIAGNIVQILCLKRSFFKNFIKLSC